MPDVGCRFPNAGGVEAGSPGCEATPGSGQKWDFNPGRGCRKRPSSHALRGADPLINGNPG